MGVQVPCRWVDTRCVQPPSCVRRDCSHKQAAKAGDGKSVAHHAGKDFQLFGMGSMANLGIGQVGNRQSVGSSYVGWLPTIHLSIHT